MRVDNVPDSVTVGQEIGLSSAITFEPAARLISKVMIVFFITSYLRLKNNVVAFTLVSVAKVDVHNAASFLSPLVVGSNGGLFLTCSRNMLHQFSSVKMSGQ